MPSRTGLARPGHGSPISHHTLSPVEKTYNGLWHGLFIPVFTLSPLPYEVKEPMTGVKTFLKTLDREELEFVVS